MWSRLIAAAGLIVSVVTGAVAQSPQFWPWQIEPGTSLPMLIEEGYEIVGAAGLSWPDGRQETVLFLKHGDELYKCADPQNPSGQHTGHGCYKLQPPKQ